jgi:hypothetical protein
MSRPFAMMTPSSPEHDSGWGDRPPRPTTAPAAPAGPKSYDQLVRLTLDPANFKRKIKKYVKKVGSSTSSSPSYSSETARSSRPGRPSDHYRWKGATRFDQPLVVTERPPHEPTSDAD